MMRDPLIFIVVAIAVACGSDEAELQVLKKRMKLVEDTINKEFGVEAYRELFLPNSCLMPPKEPAICGEDMIMTLNNMQQKGERELHYDMGKIEIYGDFAIGCTTYSKAKGASHVHGREFFTWKKSDGKWYYYWATWDENPTSTC